MAHGNEWSGNLVARFKGRVWGKMFLYAKSFVFLLLF